MFRIANRRSIILPENALGFYLPPPQKIAGIIRLYNLYKMLFFEKEEKMDAGSPSRSNGIIPV